MREGVLLLRTSNLIQREVHDAGGLKAANLKKKGRGGEACVSALAPASNHARLE